MELHLKKETFPYYEAVSETPFSFETTQETIVPDYCQDVARVAGETARARITGVVRGMLPAGLTVTKGMKAGDIDPRCEARHCFTVSDKARAIGGGVLEGLLYFGREKGLWSV